MRENKIQCLIKKKKKAFHIQAEKGGYFLNKEGRGVSKVE